MGLKEFKIVFDNPWSTYYPGQTVTGNIVLVLDSLKKIRGIRVSVKGVADTCWTTDKQEMDERGQYRDENQTVSAHEDYFETKYYLVGSASGGEIEIQPGEHKFFFQCALPMNLPSSFESTYGHVRYTVKATLDRPWKFDQDVKVPFTVISPLDLNQEPRAAEPIREEMSKTFCCLCCASGPLTVNYSVPVRGFVPGQSIPIKVNVDNSSGIIVDTVKLTLLKVVTFHSTSVQSDTKTEESVVAEVSKGPVESGTNIEYEQNLDLPSIPPSNLAHCSIIDLEYNLKVEACVQGWFYRNLSRQIPVFVGTIPLLNYQTPSAPPASVDSPTKPGWISPTSTADVVPQMPSSDLYPNLPPPSYEESIYGARSLWERGESDYVHGAGNAFAPRYPMYNFKQFQ